MPPGICRIALAVQPRPLPTTWETTPMTTHYCMSYWAWAYRCCSFYKRFCCRCTLRLFPVSQAPYKLRCFGCKNRSGKGSSSVSTGKNWFNFLPLTAKLFDQLHTGWNFLRICKCIKAGFWCLLICDTTGCTLCISQRWENRPVTTIKTLDWWDI